MGRPKKTDVPVDEYGIPLMEQSRVTYRDNHKQIRYIITRHPFLLEFYLYEIINNKAKKIDINPELPNFKKLDREMEKWQKELESEE